MNQGHTKFKLFTKVFSSSESVDQLLSEIENWVDHTNVAPKSIGVEYLEAKKMIVMSVGYRDDENYNVHLSSNFIGKIDNTDDHGTIENIMAKAASKYKDIICHELFITDTGDFYMVFMSMSRML